jgi:DNA-binding MarR family transcriptional regulator
MQTDPTLEDTAVETFRSLVRVTLGLKRQVQPVLAELDLTGAQFGTLLRIPPQGIPLTKLAAAAWSDPGNASGVVDRLERDGLVSRHPDPQDRRVVLVRLTGAGQSRLAAAWQPYQQRVAELLGPLHAEQLGQLSELLMAIDPARQPVGARGEV